ncbi:MAG: recombinase family protein [Actinobacteria bacterium]|nr:recombinase family protein [Actinomycetota bacterium]
MITWEVVSIKAVAVYCRVSTDEQGERGSIENQVQFALDYCERENLHVAEVYRDNGVSGTVKFGKRSAGSKLLEDARSGLFDTVLIYKLDRVARSIRIVLETIKALEEAGVKIRSMTEPFDTETSAGKLQIHMLASFADFERSMIAERSALGTTRAVRNGKWCGASPPRLRSGRWLPASQ